MDSSLVVGIAFFVFMGTLFLIEYRNFYVSTSVESLGTALFLCRYSASAQRKIVYHFLANHYLFLLPFYGGFFLLLILYSWGSKIFLLGMYVLITLMNSLVVSKFLLMYAHYYLLKKAGDIHAKIYKHSFRYTEKKLLV